MKKILAFIMSAFLVFSIAPKVVADTADNNINEVYTYAIDFLTQYYNAIDQYNDYNFDEYICSNELLEYVNLKVQAKQYKKILYGEDDVQNYNLSFKLYNYNIDINNADLFISSTSKFNYKGADFDSAYGEIHHIKIKIDDYSYYIEDWINLYDDYDEKCRISIDKAATRENNPKLTIDTSKQEDYNEQIKKYYLESKSKLVDIAINQGKYNIFSDSYAIQSNLSKLNKSNMVKWANNNCKEPLPTTGNSKQVKSYYDFSTITDNYDCTNFVSHAIIAGGANVYDTGNTGLSPTGWYFRNINNRSYSWSSVKNLYDFLTSNTNKGPTGTHVDYASIYAPSGNYPYDSGDIMQFHNGNIWIHSTIITGYAALPGSSTSLEPTVTGRSWNGKFNYNQRQSEVYTGWDRRIIKLEGYIK